MSGDIVLSPGIRQNLLALQNTAQLQSITQERLATGRKVNSAVDNPSSYFTAQSLTSRASDLNALLDQIGQAVQTLQAANNGLTSLTGLLQSAKSIATQAQQATSAVNTYAAVDASANIFSAANLNGSESTASLTGTADLQSTGPIALSSTPVSETLGTTGAGSVNLNTTTIPANETLQIVVNDRGTTKTFDVALHTGDNASQVITDLLNTPSQEVGGADTLGNYLGVSQNANHQLTITANTSDVSFSVSADGSGSTGTANTDVGLTAGPYDSSNLLSQLGVGAQGKTLVVSGVNANQLTFSHTITFGTGVGQVETLADLNTQLSAFSNDFSGAVSTTTTGTTITGSLTIDKAASQYASVTISGSNGVAALLDSTSQGLFGTHDSVPTLTDLGNELTPPQDLSGGGSLNLTVNGTNYTVGIGPNDRASDIISDLEANNALAANLNFSTVTDANNNQRIEITAKNPSVNFTVNANATSAALGLTADPLTSQTVNSTSLLDLLGARLLGTTYNSSNVASYQAAAQGTTLTVTANNGTVQTITFGTGTGQVGTFAQLQTALQGLSVVTTSLSNAGALDIGLPSGTNPTSLAVGGTAAASLGLAVATQTGAVTSTTPNTTRATLQQNYNDLLTQIDSLAKDASYNGINLLYGDNLKILYNDAGTSSQTIQGVTLDSNGLGLTELNASQFQNNTQIDAVISAINAAISTVQTQASTFGSNLTTIQTRQDFTKNLVTTLQTGSDNLVLADPNLEGANMLALQTRQQLSTTALSLANQASQAVLKLFG